MAGPKATAQYEAVRAKIADGLSVKEAVEAVARELGMTRASVQTTYYRTRHELDDRPAPVITSRSSIGSAITSEELLKQAVEALTVLARRAESQEKDLERLRRIERALTEDT